MKRLAILGGTFNPVHLGHLLLAEAALTQCRLDAVLWVPSRYAPYKASAEILDFHHRVEMIKRAIAPHPQFHLAVLNPSESETSYAADLLQHLQAHHATVDWHWIIGLDAFQSLPQWHRHELLIQHCTWLVAPRFNLETTPIPDLAISGLPHNARLADWVTHETEARIQRVVEQAARHDLCLRWRALQLPLIPISSQRIRQQCKAGQSIRYVVPDAVHQYITTHQLYGVDCPFPH